MSRLVLKFETETLKEVPLGTRPVTIGRAPDNDIHIDNLGVSDASRSGTSGVMM